MNYWKYITVFGIKLAIALKKKLIVNQHKQKILKTKLRSCSDKRAEIYDKKVPKVGSNYTFLTVLLLDSVLKKDRNYYPQVLGE